MRRMSFLTVLLVLLSGCGSDGVEDDDSAVPTAVADSPSEDTTTDDATSPEATDTATPAATDTATPTATPTATDGGALPGEEVDLPFTRGELGVVGVEADDVLNVRTRPGAGEPVVTRLDPLTRGLTPTERARRVRDSIWLEITVDGDTGWVNSRFARLVDGTDDITSQIVGAGDVIVAPTLVELAEEVVDAYGLGDGYEIVWGPERDAMGPEDQRRVVISDGPSVGDLGEVTVDVIDTFDDSIAAERLTIFARPMDDAFELRTVERTFFCARAGGGGDTCA